jgi:hypothetical protein
MGLLQLVGLLVLSCMMCQARLGHSESKEEVMAALSGFGTDQDPWMEGSHAWKARMHASGAKAAQVQKSRSNDQLE